MSALRQKLKGEIQQTVWVDLMQHVLRDAVFMVRDDLKLLDVAVAVAEDDTEKVAEWVTSQKMARPSKLEIEARGATVSDKFDFIICAPFVLVQPARQES